MDGVSFRLTYTSAARGRNSLRPRYPMTLALAAQCGPERWTWYEVFGVACHMRCGLALWGRMHERGPGGWGDLFIFGSQARRSLGLQRGHAQGISGAYPPLIFVVCKSVPGMP